MSCCHHHFYGLWLTSLAIAQKSVRLQVLMSNSIPWTPSCLRQVFEPTTDDLNEKKIHLARFDSQAEPDTDMTD